MIPCKDCLIISRCIAGILDIKENWIDAERIIDDNIDDAEVLDEFDSEIMDFLVDRCELFKKYFPFFVPAYHQIQYPPLSHFDHGLSEKEWHKRADEIQKIFFKYYPLGDLTNEEKMNI